MAIKVSKQKPVEEIITEEELLPIVEVLQDIKGMVNNVPYDLKKGQEVEMTETAIWIFKDRVKVVE